MIRFRCWYCNKHYAVPEGRIGKRLTCSCQRLVRVPKRSGGLSRAKTLTDWLVETVIYGGGGALLGLGLAVLILSRWRGGWVSGGWVFALSFTGVGFLAGLLGGERGLNWVGRMIRERENS